MAAARLPPVQLSATASVRPPASNCTAICPTRALSLDESGRDICCLRESTAVIVVLDVARASLLIVQSEDWESAHAIRRSGVMRLRMASDAHAGGGGPKVVVIGSGDPGAHDGARLRRALKDHDPVHLRGVPV